MAGIDAARGQYVIMADSDDSYDLSNLGPFIDKLREGHDVVMGNRFKGGIAPGAMPPLHRYLGNPVLSWLGRTLFKLRGVGDFHCGIRGFSRERILALGLCMPGMEFASELVVRASLAGYSIVEVPTTLRKDGRSRPPHLRTWRDGWRHLRFLLVLSPRRTLVQPGFVLAALGAIATLALTLGPGPGRRDRVRRQRPGVRLPGRPGRHPAVPLRRLRRGLRPARGHRARTPPGPLDPAAQAGDLRRGRSGPDRARSGRQHPGPERLGRTAASASRTPGPRSGWCCRRPPRSRPASWSSSPGCSPAC